MDVGYANGGLVEALNAKVYGNGTQTLVLSHGYGADQTVWHYLLPYLVCYFKVVVFDMAFSAKVISSDLYDPKRYSSYYFYARDLRNLLDQLHLRNTIYLGHSMSAMVGCIAASQRPDLIKHLILLNGSPRYLNDEGYNGGFERSDVEALFKDIELNFHGWVANFVPRVVGVNDTNAIKEFKRSLERMKPSIALGVAKTIFLSDNRNVLKHVKVSSTIIQSERDIIVPISVAFYLKRMLGGSARVKILKTEGHLPQLTAYTLLLHVIKGLLGIDEKVRRACKL